MNASTIGPSTMHRAQFYLRAILPDPISIQTSAQAVRAEAIGVLAKRGLEVDFEIVAIFYK